MPTLAPLVHPNVESVGVVDLFAPVTASPCTTSTGVTLPLSKSLVCKVNSLGAAPKPCAPRSTKLAAAVGPGVRTRLACATLLDSSAAAATPSSGVIRLSGFIMDFNLGIRHSPLKRCEYSKPVATLRPTPTQPF